MDTGRTVRRFLTPVAIGAMITPLGGIPAAISVVAIGPVVGALLVLRYAPETRALTLEEVQVKLAKPQRDATSSAN